MLSAVVLSCAYARDMKHMARGLAVSRFADVFNIFCHKKSFFLFLFFFWGLVNCILSDNSLYLVDKEKFKLKSYSP